MANAESKHPVKDQHGSGNQTPAAPKHTKHIDTGEHAKKNTTERAHVVDEGLGMSKLEIPGKR